MRSDPLIEGLLNRLRGQIMASQHAMWNLGVAAACKECEDEEGGSCCGAGIENRYTSFLLLMNLLLGESLPEKRSYENSCFFLGKTGCTLKARDTICVNYLCLKIQNRLHADAIIKLQEITGEEMDTTFRLHEAIKRFIDR